MKLSTYSFILLFTILFAIIINPINLTKSHDQISIENEEEEEIQNHLSPPVFSLESGYYDSKEIKELTLTSNNIIYYTLDSSDPKSSETAKVYTKPIEMYDRSKEENVYSKYKHEEDSPYSITLKTQFTPSNYPVDKLTIIKAVSQNEQGEFSDTITKVYIVMDSDKLKFYSEVPLISVVTEPANLFDKDIGIYVCGQQYLDWKNSDQYDPNKSEFDRSIPANFYMKGKEWEKEATITYFQNGKFEFEQNMGIRMKGQTTRGTINKSFNVFARKEYKGGKGKLTYDLFEDNFSYNDGRKIEKYDSFGIRTISWWARTKENLFAESLKEFKNMGTFNNKRCNLFLDGEYWGLSDLVEKSSPYYILTNYGIPEENVLIVKNYEIEEGEKSETTSVLNQIHNFCINNDLSLSENYEKFVEQVDIDSLIEYFSLVLYLGLWDRPNRNFILWRNKGEKIEGNPYSDGKWRFSTFDFDSTVNKNNLEGLEDYAFDYYNRIIEQNKAHYPASMFAALVSNSEFKQKFAKYFTTLSEDIFEPNKMVEIINESEEKYTDQLTLTFWRWWDTTNAENDRPSEIYVKYQVNGVRNHFEELRQFFTKRPEYALKYMKTHLGLE